ncbi:MAG: hypothetical protein BYD32DRAFT_111332 [Podila humilis]|nr:MAG: hypothetical protein BYD32DRAFT_111332 [Podila humilis]
MPRLACSHPFLAVSHLLCALTFFLLPVCVSACVCDDDRMVGNRGHIHALQEWITIELAVLFSFMCFPHHRLLVPTPLFETKKTSPKTLCFLVLSTADAIFAQNTNVKLRIAHKSKQDSRRRFSSISFSLFQPHRPTSTVKMALLTEKLGTRRVEFVLFMSNNVCRFKRVRMGNLTFFF